MRNFCQYIFLLVFVFTFNLQGYSQTLFNIKGGVGLQNQANSDGDFKLAFNAGISYEYKFSDFLWIDLGVDYTQKGTDLGCLLYTSPSPRDKRQSRMPSSA